jgi:thiol-disulfide isomerase/thioredoxin
MKICTFLIYAIISFNFNCISAHEVTQATSLNNLRIGEMKKLIIHKQRKSIPDLMVTLSNNENFTINKKSGKVILLNFWATWCVPCREEMPSLQVLQENLGNDDFAVVTIAAGRNRPAAMAKFFREMAITELDLYRDPKGKLASSMGVFGLPTTIIIDQHGQEFARLIGGANWMDLAALNILNSIVLEHKSKK